MALAMAVAAFAVYLATRFPGSSPRLLSEADDPALAAGEFLEALSVGDYGAAAGYLQGRPALGLDRLPDTEPERLLTEAFRESWQWTAGDIWHKDAEARLPVEFTALDITKLTAGLEEDVLDILALWLASAQRMEELYNEDNTWREDVVLRATVVALQNRLAHEEEYLSTTRLTLQLRWEEPQWVIVADDTLYAVLAGEVFP